MRLHGPNVRFELRVSPPGSEGWCRAEITVDTPKGHWSARDNCLRADEVSQLAAWLESTQRPPGDEAQIQFLEPELAFEYTGADLSTIRVYLAWNLRPRSQWGSESEEFAVDFPVTEKVRHQAAASLRKQVGQRPDNGKR
jgi:hypothetical protein